jgi:diacylglycerol O-acyltransferase
VASGPLALATWEDDPSFSLERHVEHVHLERRGARALEGFASEVASHRLDPDRPLWRMIHVDGYDGGSAIVTKLHHCIGDGFALVGVLLSLADELAAAPGPHAAPHHMPAYRDLRLHEAAPAAVLHALTDPARALQLAGTGLSFTRSLARMATLPFAPATVLSRPLSGRRRAAWSRGMPLEKLRRVARSRGATVNDLLGTALAGALRGHLAARGEPVDRFDVRALVPVNLRDQLPENLGTTLGNCFGLVFLDLPVHLRTAPERLEAVRASMAELKRTPDAVVTYAVLWALGHLPRPLEWLVTEFFSRKASLVLTNVPGPRRRLHLAGHEIRRIAFCVPHAASVGLGISILSYGGEVRMGARADESVMPDPHDLVARIPAEIEALRPAPA